MSIYSEEAKNVKSQTTKIREDQVMNNAGGFVFEVTKWNYLDRFLLIGSDTGTYYVDNKAHTNQNTQNVMDCIEEDAIRVVDRIVEISTEGRAPKNDPCLYALALVASYASTPEDRRYALSKLTDVARIGTHLFHFVDYVNSMRGWTRSLKKSVSDWYLTKSNDSLAYQAVKYQSRDGWSHRDVLRVAHPKTNERIKNDIFSWITKGSLCNYGLIGTYEKVKNAENKETIISLIKEEKLEREMIPTVFLNERDVWSALVPNLKGNALLRNLSTISRYGLMNKYKKMIISKFSNEEFIKANRFHPINLAYACKNYSCGSGASSSWNVDSDVIDVLDNAIEMSFKNVEKTGKRIMLALDVSGSMTSRNNTCGRTSRPDLMPIDIEAIMSIATIRAEDDVNVIAFSNNVNCLEVNKNTKVLDFISEIRKQNFVTTDCSLPMLHALKNNLKIDCFIVYTDNETFYGKIHPYKALKKYRAATGINAKLIVCAITSTKFSIADPRDPRMLDICGFDSATPALISEFIKG